MEGLLAFAAINTVAVLVRLIRHQHQTQQRQEQNDNADGGSPEVHQGKTIAILNCPGGYDYVPMFIDMFAQNGVRVTQTGSSDPNSVRFHAFQCHESQFPKSVTEFDGYLVTGSASAAYESTEWVQTLRRVVVDVHTHKIPLVGVCFGHQIIAHSLGGEAAKNRNGWELGTSSFSFEDSAKQRLADLIGSNAVPDNLRLLAVHGDCVVKVPPGFSNLGGNENTTCQGLLSNDNTVMSVQGHPEFLPEYVHKLLNYFDSNIDDQKDTPGTHNNAIVSMQSQGVSTEDITRLTNLPTAESDAFVAKCFMHVLGIAVK